MAAKIQTNILHCFPFQKRSQVYYIQLKAINLQRNLLKTKRHHFEGKNANTNISESEVFEVQISQQSLI